MTASEEFFNAYLVCALWSSTDDDGNPLDDNRDCDDFAPEALAEMRNDCDAFCEAESDDLARYAAELPRTEWSQDARAGHDFWLTRNGHGAGFWDRGLGEL